MAIETYAIFLVNLLQDVNILRPIVYMAARDLGMRTEILVSTDFLERDQAMIWRHELKAIANANDVILFVVDTELEALQLIQDKCGVLIAASESNLSAHAPTHRIFQCAPASFVKITLQHGYECVGFLNGKAHDKAHGTDVTFGADIVCGWLPSERMRSMAASQRSKLYVTGPPLVLQQAAASRSVRENGAGLVCENLHSVRLRGDGNVASDFLTMFSGFCDALGKEGKTVALRPHPGGQYVLKKKIELPQNVEINNDPIYKVDLSAFAYGVSAPSSVLIDLVLARVPVAVWRDRDHCVDTGNYAGLTTVCSLEEWIDFSRDAVARRDVYLERQKKFLDDLGMPIEPETVYCRFASLLQMAQGTAFRGCEVGSGGERVMMIANSCLASVQMSLEKPLAGQVDSGVMETGFISEEEMRETFNSELAHSTVCAWLARRLHVFSPTILVFSRYSGPHARFLRLWASQRRIPTIYHIDDDLLAVPRDLGPAKYAIQNDPSRLSTVRYLLDNVDLVYCSTARLKARLDDHGITASIRAGEISSAGDVIVPARRKTATTIGYMATRDHAHDFKIVVPAIVKYLRRNPSIVFEIFGSVPKPVELDEFGPRIVTTAAIGDYEAFLAAFAKREWDIGIAPLAPIAFNLMKSVTKWVEYTSVGVAVIASRDTVYDACCDAGRGLLAGTEQEWLAALEVLTHDDATRFLQVQKAQRELREAYNVTRLTQQLLSVFGEAREHCRNVRKRGVATMSLK